MSDFGDLRSFLDRDLTLTIGGIEYTVPAPTAERGLDMKAQAVTGKMTDFEETVMGVELLGGKWDADKGKWIKTKGSVFAKLMQDQDWDAIYRTAKTALLYYTISHELAVNFWQHGTAFPENPYTATGKETSQK